jgi:Tn3 transposase DDE domain
LARQEPHLGHAVPAAAGTRGPCGSQERDRAALADDGALGCFEGDGARHRPAEARNALARAIFFCQLGELRDRAFERQAYRASGLNLVVAAVILWNTRYLELAAADLGIGPDVMRHVAPLGWEHLSLTGDYAWDADNQPDPGELRPLRTKPSLLAA